ncbi:hypothetical protein M413DRAFT_241240 [Hebeloma cylindrosporum]|uniref:Uncharacterized protein n=1 Tax=Hebeloma cylindrosporum TaxID=76867 RepID=A0A0C3C573_HEBCY|nr:hypothetical protein M413DRAFT_241240 [Hebeloma cylindrosporum h7]
MFSYPSERQLDHRPWNPVRSRRYRNSACIRGLPLPLTVNPRSKIRSLFCNPEFLDQAGNDIGSYTVSVHLFHAINAPVHTDGQGEKRGDISKSTRYHRNGRLDEFRRPEFPCDGRPANI